MIGSLEILLATYHACDYTPSPEDFSDKTIHVKNIPWPPPLVHL